MWRKVACGVRWAFGCGAACLGLACTPGDGGPRTGSTTSAMEARRSLRGIGQPSSDARARVPWTLSALLGHADAFVVRRLHRAVFFDAEGVTFSLPTARGTFGVRCAVEGGAVAPFAEGQAPGVVHEYVGPTTGWSTARPTYERVVFQDVHPGVDWVAAPTPAGLSYRFVVSPGSRLDGLRLRWDGVSRVTATADGRGYDVATAAGTLSARGLRAFVQEPAGLVELAARHVVEGRTVSVAVDGWDGRRPLLIDPVIGWSTYHGGGGSEDALATAVDGAGNVYVAGTTQSADLPKVGAFDGTIGGTTDAFVAKWSSAGALVFSTYLGGSLPDRGTAVAVDAGGNVFVAGATNSSDFPATGGFATTLKGTQDAFVTKLAAAGTLAWSSYHGGSDPPEDRATALAVDGSGNVFVAGVTSSNDFPTSGGFDTSYGGDWDGWVTKVSNGGALQWSTYLGGALDDVPNGLATDGTGSVLVVGNTVSSVGFPTTAGFDTSHNGGSDVFVTKIAGTGALTWSSYLGGSGSEYGLGVAVDASGNAFVVGQTLSNSFPVTAGLDTTLGGVSDAFVAKIASPGSLLWATYLGGGAADGAHSVCVDATGGPFVVGSTSSSDFPTSAAFDGTLGGSSDAFVTQLGPTGSVVFSSYLGGAGTETARGVACKASGNVFVTGTTTSADFPATPGFDATLGGSSDAFVVKLGGGKANGTSCTFAYDCTSSFCVDGVCCDKACGGTCEACSSARKGSGADGACGPVADGADPRLDCAAQSCAAGTVTKAQVCNGAGACRAAGTTSCGLFACSGVSCATSCTSDGDCLAVAHCSGGVCVADGVDGAACTSNAQCKSGACADGVCCDKACTGDCEACTAAKKGSGVDGVCAPVSADTDPRDRCAADTTPGSCAADGLCDGVGACRKYAKKGVACGATTCSAGSVSGKTCNGAGTCETATTACAPYVCGASACKATCASDADCAADAYCNAASACAPKQKAGAACTDGRECDKGFCVDGVCCESACTGQCEACAESGTLGKCVPAVGAPRGKRTPCAGDPSQCGGACDGTNPSACKLAPATKACGSKCSGGRESPSTCDGLGACVSGAERSCAPYICKGDKSCGTTCAADADCASGFRCSGDACVPDTATCSADGTSTIQNGRTTSCAPARCRGGLCIESCSSTDDCVPGYACDAASHKCTALPTGEASEGGCATGGPLGPAGRGGWLVGAVGLLLAVRRRASLTSSRRASRSCQSRRRTWPRRRTASGAGGS